MGGREGGADSGGGRRKRELAFCTPGSGQKREVQCGLGRNCLSRFTVRDRSEARQVHVTCDFPSPLLPGELDLTQSRFHQESSRKRGGRNLGCVQGVILSPLPFDLLDHELCYQQHPVYLFFLPPLLNFIT